MRRRPAFSLAELVVAMTAGSVLLTVAIGTVHRSMTVHRQGQTHDRGSRTLARLARDFRRDVRHAATAELDGKRLTLSPADGSSAPPVVYEVDGHRLSRRQRRRGEAVRLETYEVNAETEFSIASTRATSQLRLIVAEPTLVAGAPRRLLAVIEATPGGGRPKP